LTTLRIFVLWLVLALPAAAQSIFPTDETPPPAAESDAAAQLVEILRDDVAREELIRQLEAGAAEVDPAVTRPGRARTAGVARPPDRRTHPRRRRRGDGLPVRDRRGERPGRSRRSLAGTPVNWAELNQALVSLLLVGAVTLALFFVLRAIAARVYAAMGARTDKKPMAACALLIVGSSVIDALIIVLAWAGGYAFALFIGEPGTMDFRQSLFLNAFLLSSWSRWRCAAFCRRISARLRFAPMSDETAAYWYFWSSRLVSLLGYGILLVVPIINAAVSFAVGRSVTVLIVVIALLIAILIVLQNRVDVARALRARHERDPEDMIGRIEAFFAGFWHWLAIAYLVALFIVWTAGPAMRCPSC
jgi:moderate conductance mechanosensitive channel